MKRDQRWCPLCRELTIQRKVDQDRWMCDKCHPKIKETNAGLDSESRAEAQTQKEMP